ncbi:hypothetical protein BASA81_008593 [Batrachochytrium salamandrivorans]|nr:hypothetical protein BASA81_008593 [Batrachochytrium salamandrivorans]
MGEQQLKRTCDACVTSKTRCSGALPCTRCEGRKIDCFFRAAKSVLLLLPPLLLLVGMLPRAKNNKSKVSKMVERPLVCYEKQHHGIWLNTND